jgi:UDP:flavonoid glycosyltransferase YjiC (YdhE family)
MSCALGASPAQYRYLGAMRVLFFCEPCTLSHVLRPLAYARLLPRGEFECHVACAYDPARHCPPGERWPFHAVGGCVTNHDFTAALARGTLPYDRHVIERYVDEDLRILGEVQPDVVVGDFRLSLGISAPLRRVPYVAIVNAVWSPFAQRAFPVPELPVVRALGLPLASALFPLFRPLVFEGLARPFNRVRRARGLGPFGSLLEVYSAGDLTVYPDLPQLFPVHRLPSTHRFLGPLKLGPHVPLPDWWDRVPTERPWVYVAMGTSGRAAALSSIIEALAALDVEVLVATSERGAGAPARSNVWVSEWLPLDPVLQRARVAVGNGGTGGMYYALAHGVPALSIPANMDQHMVAEAVVRAGAGLLVRSDRADPARIKDAVARLLEQTTYRDRARALGSAMHEGDVSGDFQRLLHEARRTH